MIGEQYDDIIVRRRCYFGADPNNFYMYPKENGAMDLAQFYPFDPGQPLPKQKTIEDWKNYKIVKIFK